MVTYMTKDQDLVDIANKAGSAAIQAASNFDEYLRIVKEKELLQSSQYATFCRTKKTRMYPPSPPERKPERDNDEELPF